MKNEVKNKESGDIELVQNVLIGLGFICNSYPSAQHLIYSKDGEIVIIKNKKKINLK